MSRDRTLDDLRLGADRALDANDFSTAESLLRELVERASPKLGDLVNLASVVDYNLERHLHAVSDLFPTNFDVQMILARRLQILGLSKTAADVYANMLSDQHLGDQEARVRAARLYLASQGSVLGYIAEDFCWCWSFFLDLAGKPGARQRRRLLGNIAALRDPEAAPQLKLIEDSIGLVTSVREFVAAKRSELELLAAATRATGEAQSPVTDE